MSNDLNILISHEIFFFSTVIKAQQNILTSDVNGQNRLAATLSQITSHHFHQLVTKQNKNPNLEIQ